MLPAAPTAAVLLTLRLSGSLAAATTRELRAAHAAAPADGAAHHRAQKALFARLDAALDQPTVGPRYFEDEKMAETLAGEFEMLPETGFVLRAFAILPNHAHAVLYLPPGTGLSLPKSLDLLHLRTGAACRRLVRPKLPPAAEFWHPSWHELPLADADETARAVTYVQANARRAGLPPRFQSWPYVNE